MSDDRQHHSAIVSAVATVAELYERDLSREAYAIYARALEHVSLDDLLLAIHRHVTDVDAGRFMPRPAHLLAQLNRDSAGQAIRAWDVALEAIRGKRKPSTIEDALTHQAVSALGGWHVLGRGREADTPKVAEAFMRHYRTLADERTDRNAGLLT